MHPGSARARADADCNRYEVPLQGSGGGGEADGQLRDRHGQLLGSGMGGGGEGGLSLFCPQFVYGLYTTKTHKFTKKHVFADRVV